MGDDDDESRERIGRLFDLATSGMITGAAFENYLTVTTAEAETILASTGFDVAGYCHIVDSSAIRHIVKHHGNAEKEAQRGQIAVQRDDFVNLAELIGAAESILNSGKTKQGRDTIRYSNTGLVSSVFVEELRTGRKQLAAVTLYKGEGREA